MKHLDPILEIKGLLGCATSGWLLLQLKQPAVRQQAAYSPSACLNISLLSNLVYTYSYSAAKLSRLAAQLKKETIGAHDLNKVDPFPNKYTMKVMIKINPTRLLARLLQRL
ncbi:hypothetical protein SETIT_7G191300v2 [Setaria italica]|uniref:Uncharacterized protein n=1 Tax=Setaria italica TaxID=4555 RepID=A0A368RXN2_SETIT|nr:hypothetical protein SETIT_7G191300v2 [Setaria italica]